MPARTTAVFNVPSMKGCVWSCNCSDSRLPLSRTRRAHRPRCRLTTKLIRNLGGYLDEFGSASHPDLAQISAPPFATLSSPPACPVSCPCAGAKHRVLGPQPGGGGNIVVERELRRGNHPGYVSTWLVSPASRTNEPCEFGSMQPRIATVAGPDAAFIDGTLKTRLVTCRHGSARKLLSSVQKLGDIHHRVAARPADRAGNNNISRGVGEFHVAGDGGYDCHLESG